jgi:putative peptide maturation system protein
VIETTLLDAFRLVRAAASDGCRPAEAEARLGVLAARHRDLRFDLIGEEEACTGRHAYELIVDSDDGAATIGWVPATGVPWPLRQTRRWNEQDLVKVGRRVLQVEQAMGVLDFVWRDVDLRRQLVDACLVEEAIHELGIDVSEDERQQALDDFRVRKGLYTSAATQAFMEAAGLTELELERRAVAEEHALRLRRAVVAGRGDAELERRARDYDRVTFARVELASEAAALAFAARVRGEGADFYRELEREASLAGEAPATTLTTLHRAHAQGDLAALFDARAGDVMGPWRTSVLRVVEVRAACADLPTRRAIERRLFEDWLAERRARTTVEWLWGR